MVDSSKLMKKEKYIEEHVAIYIIQKVFPDHNRFINFHYYKEYITNVGIAKSGLSYAPSSYSSLPSTAREYYSSKVFDEVKLGLRQGRSAKNIASIKEQRREFKINLATKKFVFNVIFNQFYNEFNKNFNWLFYSILPLGLQFIFPPSAILYWPLLLGGTALILISRTVYHSYNVMVTAKAAKLKKISENIEIEEELIKEHFQAQKYENEIKLTDLTNLLTLRATLFAYSESLDYALTQDLKNLYEKIKDNPGISLISKYIIREMSQFNEESYNPEIVKKLSKLSYKPSLESNPDEILSRKDRLSKAIQKVLKALEVKTNVRDTETTKVSLLVDAQEIHLDEQDNGKKVTNKTKGASQNLSSKI